MSATTWRPGSAPTTATATRWPPTRRAWASVGTWIQLLTGLLAHAENCDACNDMETRFRTYDGHCNALASDFLCTWRNWHRM